MARPNQPVQRPVSDCETRQCDGNFLRRDSSPAVRPGYVLGGLIGAHFGWRWAFYALVLPGLILGSVCFTLRDPPRTGRLEFLDLKRSRLRDYLMLFRTRSYVTNTVAQTITTFVLGGLGFWFQLICVFEIKVPPREWQSLAASWWLPGWCPRCWWSPGGQIASSISRVPISSSPELG